MNVIAFAPLNYEKLETGICVTKNALYRPDDRTGTRKDSLGSTLMPA